MLVKGASAKTNLNDNYKGVYCKATDLQNRYSIDI